MRRLWLIVRGRPRLAIGLLCGLLAWPLLPTGMLPLARSIVAWDIGCTVFLVLAAHLFSAERMARMPDDAAMQQEGEWTIFCFSIGAVTASFAAILGVFAGSKDLAAGPHSLYVALVAVTLLVSWLMTHTLFALRYAHEYYSIVPGGVEVEGGLKFPGDGPPDYWDFFYYALVLGMTFQVSDVEILSRKLRRLASVHGLLGFLFNTVILALSVNIAASLL
jgi:uncharacterized membrane protein